MSGGFATRARAGALLCAALLASCGEGVEPGPASVETTIAQSPPGALPRPDPAAPELGPVPERDAGRVLLGRADLARDLGRGLVEEKESSAPFPDQHVTPQACMTAVDIGFARQLGSQWSSFGYYYARTPQGQGPVEVVAEAVALYPVEKGAQDALDALSADLGRCSGAQAVQRAARTQTWQVAAAPLQLNRIVWTTTQVGSHDWRCDYQAQTRSNAFFTVMFCTRGDAGGMAASLMRALAVRIG